MRACAQVRSAWVARWWGHKAVCKLCFNWAGMCKQHQQMYESSGQGCHTIMSHAEHSPQRKESLTPEKLSRVAWRVRVIAARALRATPFYVPPPQGYRSSFLGTVLSLLILSVRPEPYTLSVFLHSFPRGTASWILRHQEQVKFSKEVAAGIFFCVVGRWFILLRQKFPISSQIILKNKTVG